VLTAMAMPASGRFIQKAQRHVVYSLKTPPKRGPTPSGIKWSDRYGRDGLSDVPFEMAITPSLMPWNLPLSCKETISEMIISVIVMIAPPPIPWKARKMMS
jgi:hypothetical protein